MCNTHAVFLSVFAFLCLNQGKCRSSARAGPDQDRHEQENQNPGQAAASAGHLRPVWSVSCVVVIKYGTRCVIQTAMMDENLPRATVVVRADGSTLFKLPQEVRSAFVTDVETVAQHHRRDGRAVGQELQRLIIQGS